VSQHIINLIETLTKTVDLQGQAILDLSAKLEKNTQQIEDNTNVVGDLDITAITEKVNHLEKEKDKAKEPTFHQFNLPPPPPPPAPKNQSVTYANVTKRSPPTKKPTKKPLLFTPDYTRVNRELVIQLDNPRPKPTDINKILVAVNNACSAHGFVFLSAQLTQKGNITLLSPPSVSASEAVKFHPEIKEALKSLDITALSTTANSRWSKFIVHGIPTTIGEGTEAATALGNAIHLAAPTINLAQAPRWLSTTKQREGKSHSSMVVALPAKYTMATLGFKSLPLFNKFCRFETYIESSAHTQCRKCQSFGHHQNLCREKLPKCAICLESHLTTDHKCNSCKGGAKCTHPPFRCANCGQAHKAFDNTCPSRPKIPQIQVPATQPDSRKEV
jgi:hypothetical protein